MKDKRIEIIKAYEEVNNRPINQAVIKMERKFNPQWEQVTEMISTSQALIEALETEGDWLNLREKEIMREIMHMGTTQGLYSRQEILDFQNQVIEASLGEETPRIQTEDILGMKSLKEMNDYLLNNMDAILTELMIW
ncbi:MAG: hypothetical protein WC151_10315 [Bacteroidales bacterium]|jgi:hypothetical protein